MWCFIHKCSVFCAGLILGVVAIAHAYRLAAQIPIMIGGDTLPMWPSIAAAIIGGCLSYALLSKVFCKNCS